MKLIFKKFFHSALDPDEFSMLEEYLKSRKNEKEITRQMKALWEDSIGDSHEDSQTDPALFEQIKKEIVADRLKRVQRKLKIYSWSLRAAAVLAIALISGSVYYMRSRQDQLAQQWHIIATPFGAKTVITLPDSTTIWLNAGSSIRYSNDFGIKDREVHLSGEAFFDVYHNPSRLFSVLTSELTIRSYGTAFNVKSYPEEGTIEATLIEGSIGITRTSVAGKKTDEVLLEPNQRVVYYRKTITMEPEQTASEPEDAPRATDSGPKRQKTTYLISKGIDGNEYTSWKDGTIVISSETLEDLAVKLERKYNVNIHFESEGLKSLKFTGSLENETVEQVIHAIGISAQIDYEIEDREIWLREQLK
jgi:ferric-dicitrate binding protein FerR (iron transport regulator)